MKVLFDLNIVLDLVLDRAPFVDDAKRSVALVLDGKVDGYVTSLSVVTLYYIPRRNVGRDQALTAVERCLRTFGVLPVGRSALESAFALGGTDFEDDVQATAAKEAALDVIVTRDTDGFLRSPVPSMSPAELAAKVQ